MKKRIAIFIILIIAIVFIIGVRTEPGRVIYGTDNTVTISKNEYERLVRNNEALKKYLLLEEAREFVQQNYYKEPDNQAMMDGAIQGLLQGLGDAYTFYYPKEAWKTLWEEDEGKYAGIGVQMLGNWRDSTVTIIRVFKDTPAEKVGLRKGDVFYKVEDMEVTTATMQDAVNTMRGTPGDKVKVEIIRNGETIPFELTKAEILVNRMEYTMLENDIGYIALYEFAGEVDMEFKKALEELIDKNAKGLIIDLRDNPGGWVEQGRRIADMFLDRGLLFYTEDRQGKKESSFTLDGKIDIPLVLLVNENSASTSEIISGAMKDYGRAKLVGTNTFGKGVIQNVVPLSDGVSGMQFTVAQYFTPKGNIVHEKGIAPDVEVELPKDDKNKYFEFGSMEDPQLKKAYDVMLGEMN